MTKKHFNAIARTIAAVEMPAASRVALVDSLCVDFANANPLFDRERFVVACGCVDHWIFA